MFAGIGLEIVGYVARVELYYDDFGKSSPFHPHFFLRFA